MGKLKPDVVKIMPGFPGFPAGIPTNPAKQIRKSISLTGINSIQLAWWFQHIADKDGVYWKTLSQYNKSIGWIVSQENAGCHIGTFWESDQITPKGFFPEDRLHLQIQYMDWNTRGRMGIDNGPIPLNPVLPPPEDYVAPYPSPQTAGDINGFNEHMLIFDGQGFCIGRLLWSWVNTGNSDTKETEGQPFQVNLACTLYFTWMEGPNLPPNQTKAGYYYSDNQIDTIWKIWEDILTKLPEHLPNWWGKYSQDTIARENGWTVTLLADTPLFSGVTLEMMAWWWNHGMGDSPGNGYVFWAPSSHHTVRWLPGYSPAEVWGSNELPNDKVVPGAISCDLQFDSLIQDGSGVMYYPANKSPVPGIYRISQPMTIVTSEQVANFSSERWPEPILDFWLLHQWEEVPDGLIHRSTLLRKLPLASSVTQEEYLTEHQYLEGQYMANGFLIKLYNNWLDRQRGD